MTYALKKKFRPTGWLVAGFLAAIAAAGCGNGNKSETPAQFSPQPTTPPNGGLPKKAGDKTRGPGDKSSD
ncbi:hypothetical protein J8F10_02865 [Gemmata sp. G18]|uniref:Uncharacterized protein n=1 Tax=Gemmata palustris TaxID=2822762 RepID=A0ABS5BKK6_9BACT|nr:hypothetical protein [Gemmata palustris]MBP3954236.1 hypothetical protein [Gemmata palustris]